MGLNSLHPVCPTSTCGEIPKEIWFDVLHGHVCHPLRAVKTQSLILQSRARLSFSKLLLNAFILNPEHEDIRDLGES
jgi:hypothetical protein